MPADRREHARQCEYRHAVFPFEPTLVPLALVVGAALLIGISKTSVGGIGALSVAAFAHVMDAKESTAAVLLLLIVGDLVAVASYHKHADWRLLRRLLPAVLPGVALGAVFLNLVPTQTMKLVIGLILMVMLVLQLVQRFRPARPADQPLPPSAATVTGVAAGFTTMTANAAGPVMSLYLLAERIQKHAFIGTGAWYYLIINCSKVPFSAYLGLFPTTTLTMSLILAPVVLIGAALGRVLIKRINQIWFERFTLAATAVAAVSLLIP